MKHKPSRFHTIHYILDILVTMLLMAMWWPQTYIAAQDGNLLQNPGFDGGLTPVNNGAVPSGWALWGSPSETDKEQLGALTHSPPYSWRLRKEYGVFTGGGYQTVTVQPGATYRFSIYAMIWTCNDEQFACRNETSTFSDTTSGGRVRIGVDPAGGTNPFGNSVQWGAFRSPFTWGSFDYLSIDVKATGAQMTVFTYYTADQVMRWHDVFWDDAALVMIAPPSGNNPDPGAQPTSGPRPTAVPVQVNTQTRPDGSLIHIVQPGQNLSVIAQAYGISLATLRQLNGLLNTDIIYSGQELIIRPGTAIVPTPVPTVVVTSSLPTATPTSLAQPTAVAQNLTATLEIVRVSAAAERTEDKSLLKTGIVALAVIVIFAGMVVIGGVVVIIGLTIFRPPRV